MQVNQLIADVQHFFVEPRMNSHGDERKQRCREMLSHIFDDQNLSKTHSQLEIVSKTFVVLVQNFKLSVWLGL